MKNQYPCVVSISFPNSPQLSHEDQPEVTQNWNYSFDNLTLKMSKSLTETSLPSEGEESRQMLSIGIDGIDGDSRSGCSIDILDQRQNDVCEKYYKDGYCLDGKNCNKIHDCGMKDTKNIVKMRWILNQMPEIMLMSRRRLSNLFD